MKTTRSDVVWSLTADNQSHRVEVTERPDGLFEVRCYRWHREVVPDHGEVCEPYWADCTQGKTLTDQREVAIRAAKAELQLLGAG